MDFNQLFRKKSVDIILKQAAEREEAGGHQLTKNLTLRDLVVFGIAAIIGAGIFSTIGKASFEGGPAVILLFVFTAIACTFSAMCYAEFASRIPLSGSAYTYAYASFGELMAWILGWGLVMEYAVGNIVVAISWSDYFTSLMRGFHIHIPEYLCLDYFTAHSTWNEVSALLASGTAFDTLTETQREGWTAWENAPQLGGLKLIADIPAFVITVLITYLVYVGIRESKRAGNIMVLLKLIIVFFVIAIGAFYVDPARWSPFAPNGFAGILKGISGVFFAYIGFDAISTTAEECKNPQRDLPRSMFISLVLCTILYIIIALILTGMVSYKELNVGDPLAHAFQQLNLTYFSNIIGISAIIAIAGVLLVYQMGQPRIWMSMSRDGLLPKKFSKVHPKYKTPAFATLVTGVVVAVPSLFVNLDPVVDLTSVGTLFAFVLVCAGVLSLEEHHDTEKSRYKIPYVNSKYIVPVLLVGLLGLVAWLNPEGLTNFFSFSGENATWEVISHKIPMLIFIGVCIFLAYRCFTKSLSLIPVLGLLCNLYLMTELGYTNWAGFFIWLVIGLVIYFTYSYRNSRLSTREA
ncbi:MAG: APC family permease [Bacteroidota bacterium]